MSLTVVMVSADGLSKSIKIKHSCAGTERISRILTADGRFIERRYELDHIKGDVWTYRERGESSDE